MNFTDNCSDQQFQSSLGLIPASWPQPTTGQNFITKYVVDSQGRTIEETDPDGEITYTVYLDAAQTVPGSTGHGPQRGSRLPRLEPEHGHDGRAGRGYAQGFHGVRRVQRDAHDVGRTRRSTPPPAIPTGAKRLRTCKACAHSLVNNQGQPPGGWTT